MKNPTKSGFRVLVDSEEDWALSSVGRDERGWTNKTLAAVRVTMGGALVLENAGVALAARG